MNHILVLRFRASLEYRDLRSQLKVDCDALLVKVDFVFSRLKIYVKATCLQVALATRVKKNTG